MDASLAIYSELGTLLITLTCIGLILSMLSVLLTQETGQCRQSF